MPEPERAHLRQAALFRVVAHRRRVRAVDRPALLAVGQVLAAAVAVLHHPRGAVLKQRVQVRVGNPDVPALPGARGNVAEELVHQFANLRPTLLAGQRTAEQAHAAIDVKADAAGRNHAVVVRVRGRHAADGEAVALVNVGHGQRPPHDPRQHRHVDRLLEREVFEQVLQQPLVRVDERVRQHSRLRAARHQQAVIIELLQLLHFQRHGRPSAKSNQNCILILCRPRDHGAT